MADTSLIPTDSDSGKRLDRFLAEQLPDRSRSAIQRWVEGGLVTVDGKPAVSSQRVKPGQKIALRPPPEPRSDLVPEPIPLRIVYEDDSLVVVDKPSGLVVHPGAGNPAGTLANALAYHFTQMSRGGSIRPGIVHRLDKETSGLLVVAKDEQVHEALARQFKERLVEKRYLALVYGSPQPSQGLIEVPIGRHPTVRTKYSVRTRKPRSARTEYEVLRRIGDFSLLEVKLHTGRTHQIRVHLHHIGHPVVGDRIYGKGRVSGVSDARTGARIKRLGRHFLHAARLGFRHPLTDEEVVFESRLPDDLARFVKTLE